MKTKHSRKIKSRYGKGRGSSRVEVELPTEYTEPSGRLDDYSILIHGDKAIGKTSLALEGTKTLLIACDAPQKAYKRMEVFCPDWLTIESTVDKLKKLSPADFPYDRVVLDGAAIAYELCLELVCSNLGITHPGDVDDFGASWGRIKSRYRKLIRGILSLPCGRWFLVHNYLREVKVRGKKKKIERLVPDLSGQAESVLNGECDIRAAYELYRGSCRRLIIIGSTEVSAGHRVNHRFRTTEGDPIHSIDMGNSPAQARDNLLAAFANKATTVVAVPSGDSEVSNGKTKRKRKPKRRKY